MMQIIMVFGWGKKKSQENKELSQLSKEVSLETTDYLLTEKKDQENKKVVENTKPLRDEIEIKRKAILDLFSHLENDSLGSDDMDKSIQVMIERGKNSIISGVRKETSKKLDGVKNLQDVINLNSDTAQLLKRVGDILGPNSKIMHVFARKYADKLKDILADIAKSKAKLQTLLDEYDDLDKKMAEIFETKKRIVEVRNDIDLRKNEIIKNKEDLPEIDEKIESLGKEISSIRSSKEFQDFQNIKKELGLLDQEKRKIKGEVELQFSKISRPLGKYRYVSSLDKPLKTIMENLVDDPFGTITQRNKNSIDEILQAVIKSVVTGNISVKDTQKSIDQIEETISRIDEFLKSVGDWSEKKHTLNQKIVFQEKELEEKEKEFNFFKERKNQIQIDISRFEEKISHNSKTIIEESKRIESKLNEVLKSNYSIT